MQMVDVSSWETAFFWFKISVSDYSYNRFGLQWDTSGTEAETVTVNRENFGFLKSSIERSQNYSFIW